MKKASYCLVTIFLLAGFLSAGEWVNLLGQPLDRNEAVKVIESTDQYIILECQINGFERSSIAISNNEWSFVDLNHESRIWSRGNPELPRLCRSVIIPDNGVMEAHIIAAEYQDFPNSKIAPSKGHLLRSVNPEQVPYEFGAAYKTDAWYPADIVTLREPYILRDVRGQVVEVNAFQYNPVKKVLRVYTNLTVEIRAAGQGGANILQRTKPLTGIDPEFRNVYRRHFLNFDEGRYPAVDEVGPMLVITYDAFHDVVMPFVNWKNQKGIPTTIVNISTIGNDPNSIKNYIRNLYETTNLAYVLLVGDNAQVASPISGGGTDPTYALLAGGDHYPDLFVGRFSAETMQDANTQVQRTITYEKLPMLGADWYHKGTGVASNQGTGAGHYGEADSTHMNNIRADLLRFTYTEVDKIYDPYGTAAMVSNALNNGRSIVNYCGHGSTTSWGSTGFNNANVNALLNDNMLIFNTTVACLCGNFTGSTCFGEAWLRATHNGVPIGGVGFYASSQSQSWAPPMYAQDEFVDLLCAESLYSYGALCFNGSMLMIEQTGGTGQSEFDHWIVFGDPSFWVRTDTPENMTVVHDNQINYGQPTFNVTVTGVEGALCALSNEGVFLGNGFTNASGQAVIIVVGELPPGGNVTVTVTAFNKVPYFATIPVITAGPDIWPPLITHTPLTNTTSPGPYVVNATIVDYSGVASASVFYNTGVSFIEIPMINTAGNEWTASIPSQPIGTIINYYLRAVDASPQSNVATTPAYTFTVLGLIFFDDLESGIGAWTHAPISGWIDQWHLSTEMSHSPTHAWKFGDTGPGNYADLSHGELVSPVITIGNDCVLTFWHWIAAEASGSYPDSAYDGGVVEISHNGGPWTVLALPYTHHTRGANYTGPFAPGTPVFSGNSGGWAQVSGDLSSYVGDIQLRFRFGSDANTNAEGWYIDDLQIIGLPSGSLPNVSLVLTPYGTPIQIPATGGSFSYNIAVANYDTVQVSADVWCWVTLPNGVIYGPLWGPVNLNMAPGFNTNRDRTQSVPATAPAGNYVMHCYIGGYPGIIYDDDSFTFQKLETGRGQAINDWYDLGEPFRE